MLDSLKIVFPWLQWILIYCCSMTTPYGQLADTSYYYFKGKIGSSYSISVEIIQIEDSLTARYYYDKYRRVIPLKIARTDSLLRLSEATEKGGVSNYFELNFVKASGQLNGKWYDEVAGLSYPVALQKIQWTGGDFKPRFYELMKFQQFINYFDLVPAIPLQVESLLTSTKIPWLQGDQKTIFSDFKQYIPYNLAQKYIMSQASISKGGGFDYLNIPLNQYNPIDFHYRSLCSIFKTSNYISCLVLFENDTGWENHQVVYWLTYDYAGQLLTPLEVFKAVDLSKGTLQKREYTQGYFLSDSTLMIQTEQTQRGAVFDVEGHETYRHDTQKYQATYRLSNTGRLRVTNTSKDKNKDN